jgi:hypothetical protein
VRGERSAISHQPSVDASLKPNEFRILLRSVPLNSSKARFPPRQTTPSLDKRERVSISLTVSC